MKCAGKSHRGTSLDTHQSADESAIHLTQGLGNLYVANSVGMARHRQPTKERWPYVGAKLPASLPKDLACVHGPWGKCQRWFVDIAFDYCNVDSWIIIPRANRNRMLAVDADLVLLHFTAFSVPLPLRNKTPNLTAHSLQKQNVGCREVGFSRSQQDGVERGITAVYNGYVSVRF